MECTIRVLTSWVRAMLHNSGLPKFLWAEAFSTVMYVHNRTPTKALGGLTLYEVLYGVKPDVSHLRAFGAPCAVVEPSELVRKLDDQSRMCLFVGYKYEGGGYRVWDPKRRVVVESRDISIKNGLPPPTLNGLLHEPTIDDEPLHQPVPDLDTVLVTPSAAANAPELIPLPETLWVVSPQPTHNVTTTRTCASRFGYLDGTWIGRSRSQQMRQVIRLSPTSLSTTATTLQTTRTMLLTPFLVLFTTYPMSRTCLRG